MRIACGGPCGLLIGCGKRYFGTEVPVEVGAAIGVCYELVPGAVIE
jgi:hypothetical protein